jgi:hypothetical protein
MEQNLKSNGKQFKTNTMAVNKVDLTVTQLINDLNEGFTWLKKDDLGYGSIETKYNANPNQIAAIRKHPALKDAETTITIFNIIDDTKNENTTNTKESTSNRSSSSVEREVVPVVSQSTEVVSNEAADIFANL